MLFRLIIWFFLTFFAFGSSHASTLSELKSDLEKYGIAYQSNVYIEDTFSVDLTPLDTALQKNYKNFTFEYEWIISWASPKKGPLLQRDFETSGQKSVNLSIYATELITPETLNPEEDQEQEVFNEEWEIESQWEESTLGLNSEENSANEILTRSLVLQSDLRFFIFEKSVPIVVDESIDYAEVQDFIEAGKDLWVFVKELWSYSELSINGSDLISALEEYKIITRESSDYLIIWGDKEFLFSTISQIQAHANNTDLNLVLLSPFNTTILKRYIWNNISEKNILSKAFILNDTLRLQTLRNPQNINILESQVEKNSYNYISLTQWETISPWLFLSNFINKLSNNTIPVSDIYIILLLPLFLTVVSVFKHVVWISTIGIVIPIFMGLLFIKLSISFTVWILWTFLFINILISKFINKYALLYTPKVVCITILNIVFFALLYHIITYFNIVDIPLNNILYIILFYIIAEKLITIITSKEFREYKKNISGTLIVAFACYLLFQFDSLRVFLMAYPESLLIFIPINFFIGRFTWLRVTEYLRFREIIKSIEE